MIYLQRMMIFPYWRVELCEWTIGAILVVVANSTNSTTEFSPRFVSRGFGASHPPFSKNSFSKAMANHPQFYIVSSHFYGSYKPL
jgi:hypothetical protein